MFFQNDTIVPQLKEEKMRKKIKYILLPLAAVTLIIIIVFAINLCSSLDEIGKPLEKSKEFIYNHDTIYIKSEIWGLTSDHVQISVTDKRGDLNLTFYYSEIFYSIKNDSLILYAPMGTMADSSHYNKDKVKIVDLQNASEIYDMSTNHKKLGIERYSAYNK